MKMLGYTLTSIAILATAPTAASAADLYDYPPPRAAYVPSPPPPVYYAPYPRPYPYYAAYPYWGWGPRWGYWHRPYWRAGYWGHRWGRRW